MVTNGLAADGGQGGAQDNVTMRLTEHEAQANLLAVLQLCAAGKLRCSEKTQRPGAATVGVVASALLQGDFYREEPIAAFAWPLLLQAGALAELAGGRLQLTARGRTALTRPAADTIRQLWQRWVSHAVIDEMSRIEEIKGQRSARALTAAKPRRQTVAQALAGCKRDEWISVDALFARMQRQGLHPSVARDPWKLYIADPQYGSLGYEGYSEWPILEGRYTLCILFEYAGTLGLFDVEYDDPAGARDDYFDNWGTDDLEWLSRYDGLRAVRLNALGAYVFGLNQNYEATVDDSSTGRVLKVLPNLDIVITEEVRPADQLLLDAFVERSSDRVWSLGVEKLLAAIDAGRRPEQLRQFLENRAQNELPSTVTTFFADVTARAERLRNLGLVRLVECSDPALAALIAGDRRIRRFCRPVGDRHVAVPIEHEPDFRKALRVLGYVLPVDPGV
ncbi:helicase-associated domain-containing protein [Frankia sp. Cppng1_Ct_nod]|uniref:helicase-associated domain-containing protein n=1 Tax=Frankia sp. Cppng1_Ct_nod TaxID=2897162 RepID=UPI001F5FC25A|nr:helicase-associated domain-containing protein [Frankia sp. Cppng1_Ct_nod]